ncbi:MAG: hypothetical protein JNK67_27130 [Alphaproteobacteria bacterium]|nr:hypothetical protein [Alphaproteobacteria bacterium]
MSPAGGIPGSPGQLEAMIEALQDRVLPVKPLAGEDFDPMTASQQELIEVGLPPRPAVADPGVLQAWRKVVGPLPLKILAWRLSQLDSTLDYRVGAARGPASGRSGTSRNWSGIVVTARDDATRPGATMFDQVFGSWTVPMPTLPADHAADAVYRCSTWIGIDGHRRLSSSLPQIGTTLVVEVVGGQPRPPRIEVWWQWWLREHFFGPVPIANFAVDFGDEIAAALTAIDPRLVRLNLRNVTRNDPPHVVSIAAPTVIIGPGMNASAAARGLTAEWIAERPTALNDTWLHPLPDFGAVTFTGCYAIESGGALRTLAAGRNVRMVARQQSPARVAVLSRPDPPPHASALDRTIRFVG